MPPKSSNSNTKNDDKNKYVRSLIEDLRELQNCNRKTVRIDLTKVTVQQVIKLIQQNVNNKQLAIEISDGKIYMLNDSTMNKLMKGGLIDESTAANEKITGSDEELTKLTNLTKYLTLKLVEAKGDEVPDKRVTKKTRPGGGFFKFSNKTHFDFSRYGIF